MSIYIGNDLENRLETFKEIENRKCIIKEIQ